MSNTDYWKECLSCAADECGLTVTDEQLMVIAEAVRIAHNNYTMAFYSPPSSDRISDIEREWRAKLEAVNKELERYRANAETAIRQALRQRSDAHVSIGECGEVFIHGGRTERIQ